MVEQGCARTCSYVPPHTMQYLRDNVEANDYEFRRDQIYRGLFKGKDEPSFSSFLIRCMEAHSFELSFHFSMNACVLTSYPQIF